jgi:hypothetical protein
MVMLENGTEIMMKDLEIGQSVRTGAKESSDVFMFSHKFEEAIYSFLEITTKSGNKLTVTGSHFIYINGVASQAKNAKEGDFLTLANGEKSEVVSIQTVRKTGLYNPHTVHGDIVVVSVYSPSWSMFSLQRTQPYMIGFRMAVTCSLTPSPSPLLVFRMVF